MSKKRKVFVIALILLAVAVVTGYGVYSYYVTEGTFTEDETDSDVNAIHLNASFSPGFDSGGQYLLSGGDTVTLECSEPDENKEVTCTGTETVYNNGSTDIRVEINNKSSYGCEYADCDFTPSIDWTSGYDEWEYGSKLIPSGESREITISATTTIEDGTESNAPTQVSEPVIITPKVGVQFTVTATQVRNSNGY